MAEKQFLSISQVIPVPLPISAGGHYVWHLHCALEEIGTITHAVADYPSNRKTLAQPDRASNVLFIEQHDTKWEAILAKITWLWSRFDVAVPPLPTVWRMLRDRKFLQALRAADVIDLQWADWTRLTFLGFFNRRAMLVLTYHDVPLQLAIRRYARAVRRRDRIRWKVAIRLAKVQQHFALRAADSIVVFSEKDRLLVDPEDKFGKVKIVPPPLGSIGSATTPLSNPPRVAFVSYLARPDNVEALLWLIREIWPVVVRNHPTARLVIAGKGLSCEIEDEVRVIGSIDYLGFVDNLEDVYAGVACVVVPLRNGAGVKFKTIEAMLRGIPVVSTSIGVEGIGDEKTVVDCVAEDTAGIAQGLNKILDDPQAARRRALPVQIWSSEVYGSAAFKDNVARIYA